MFTRPRPAREPLPFPTAPTGWKQAERVGGGVVAQPKTEPVRSEPYRRLVAAMPCKACGIQGYSQAAHLPPEGKGTKQDDRLIFPLCCTRPGVPGCHADYDQYRMFTRAVAMDVGQAWAADTRRAIVAAGQWPDTLPAYEPKQPLALATQA